MVSGGDLALDARDLTTDDDFLRLGGHLTSQPTAVMDAEGTSVIVRGGDGGAYRNHERGGEWAGFAPLGGF